MHPTAQELCDEYCDIDMSIYYDELPSQEELQLARQQNQGSERLWVIGIALRQVFGHNKIF